MDLGLTGRTALVTGASEGIGAGIALMLAQEGVDLALCARSRDRLEARAAAIAAATGRRVVPLVADLSTLEGCQGFVRGALAALGRIDILVNNAGAARMMPFVDMPDEVFVEAYQGKLLATVRCCREVVAPMRAQGGGCIVNITGATFQAVPLHAAGGSANAAIRTFSKTLSLELAPWRIRVNSLAPGRIKTERLRQIFEAEGNAAGQSAAAIEARQVGAIPAGRLGEVEDIARLVCFVVSDAASYVNGAALTVDGGKSLLV